MANQTPKKIKIVFFELCHSATRFVRQEDAEAAAITYSRQNGYGCEAFYCERGHPNKNGGDVGPGWHVRGKIRPAATVENFQPPAPFVSEEQVADYTRGKDAEVYALRKSGWTWRAIDMHLWGVKTNGGRSCYAYRREKARRVREQQGNTVPATAVFRNVVCWNKGNNGVLRDYRIFAGKFFCLARILNTIQDHGLKCV